MENFIEATCDFENQVKKLTHACCKSCKMVSITMKVNRKGICNQCSRSRRTKYHLPTWTNAVGEEIFEVPQELACLTLVEKLLIQKISPFVPLEHIYKGTMGLCGHVCAFQQNITGITTILPRLPSDISMVRVVRQMKEEIGSPFATGKAYRVNKDRVIKALIWLKTYNSQYKDICINASNLDWIEGPEDDILRYISLLKDLTDYKKTTAPSLNDYGPSGLPSSYPEVKQYGCMDDGSTEHLTAKIARERLDLLRTVNVHARKRKFEIAWPKCAEKAVNEFCGTKIFASAFPWLFPGGVGDIEECDRESKKQWGARLLKYFDARFQEDPVFTFYANNYVTRHQNSSSGKWFIDNFHNNAPETLEELKATVREGNMEFIKSITYSTKVVKG